MGYIFDSLYSLTVYALFFDFQLPTVGQDGAVTAGVEPTVEVAADMRDPAVVCYLPRDISSFS